LSLVNPTNSSQSDTLQVKSAILVKSPKSWYILGSLKPPIGNQVRHILIILLISILLLSSPLFGQSSKFESVSQCVLQTMTEKKLTGNEMFEVVKEECERILGKVENEIDKKQEGVLYKT